jgi:uncharacterized membrane protein YeaQ/YmgE (transglycosylase-associated protein family)
MESKWLLALLVIPVVFAGSHFEAWIYTDFRRKIGNLKFFALVLACIGILIMVVTYLSR